MARIGIYGGNYNPVHKGHIMVAKAALDQCGLDMVYLMPAYVQPFKQGQKSADGEDRIHMLELASENEPNIRVSDFEMRRQGVSYTAITMEELHKAHPEDELFFIMGADSVHTFLTWYHPEIIAANASLIVAGRREEATPKSGELLLSDEADFEQINEPGEDEDAVKFKTDIRAIEDTLGVKIYVLNTPYFDVSSTQIRRMIIEKDAELTEYIPKKVAAYIEEKNLYR